MLLFDTVLSSSLKSFEDDRKEVEEGREAETIEETFDLTLAGLPFEASRA